MGIVASSLWRDRDFMSLWLGQAISDLGAGITALALPLAVVTLLDASAFEVGLLTALASVGWLIVALPAGAVIDRTRKRRLMIICDVVRGVGLASVPLTAALWHLTIWHLYLVSLLLGIFAVFFEVACQSYLASLLTRERLVEGIGRVGTTNALAAVLGPTLAGVLTSLLGSAARVLAVDCLSFLASIVSLLLIRRPEPSPRPRTPGPWLPDLRRDIAAGLRFVLNHWVMRRVLVASTAANAFDAMVAALIVVFLARDLYADPKTIGVTLAIGGVGGVVGGMVANPMARWLGPARALWAGKLYLGASTLCLPLAEPGWGIYLVSAALFVTGVVTVSYNVLQIAYRQSICPPELRGRMNASVRWIIRSLVPMGALIAGALAIPLGVRTTLAIAVVGSWLAVMPIVLSPLRLARDLPDALEPSDPGTEPAAMITPASPPSR
ncbi:MFS transporter [Micromonospora yangpuensis]|uniref:Predicted arabinose efflux permease, MFS family n=2 Tax=Micromonospora yangpuensis TaxID=683228 RepID=A0A1C6UWJ7_9ACTN|nr:MFS transporter [Micromonospora yangpuensis]SCL58351.1 Predicted arabinose efflux permease, MFS family [Micromonospora yangpuensis]